MPDNTQKFSQLWKAQRGFRIIRKSKRSLEIQRNKITLNRFMSWVVIGHYPSERKMEEAFEEMLLDDMTITEDCYATDFK